MSVCKHWCSIANIELFPYKLDGLMVCKMQLIILEQRWNFSFVVHVVSTHVIFEKCMIVCNQIAIKINKKYFNVHYIKPYTKWRPFFSRQCNVLKLAQNSSSISNPGQRYLLEFPLLVTHMTFCMKYYQNWVNDGSLCNLCISLPELLTSYS